MSVPVVSERHHRSTIQLTIQHCNEVSGNICTKIQHKIHTQKPDKVTKQVVVFFGNKILQYSRHGSNNITVQSVMSASKYPHPKTASVTKQMATFDEIWCFFSITKCFFQPAKFSTRQQNALEPSCVDIIIPIGHVVSLTGYE